jgi:hypothetical protein
MIELLLLACLATGECREFSKLYEGQQVSLLTCMVGGQREIVLWTEMNPGWKVVRWSCGYYESRHTRA